MKNLFKRLGSLCLCALLVCAALPPALGLEEAAHPVLTDLEDCAHREAVVLMVDLGVIDGKKDGTFAPNETIDRASMAKLIYSIMMGSADPKNFLNVKTDLTDIKGTWAEGYINYCYSVGIVSGSKGHFLPTGKVTVDAAAKMLLVALGYGAVERGYEGTRDWAENIRRDAFALGLLTGLTQEGAEEITRDNAAQMIYNALFIQTRTPVYAIYDGERRIVDYRAETETLGLRSFGLVKCVLSVTGAVPDSSRVSLTLLSVTPQGALFKDEHGLIEDIALGRAAFQLGPDWDNTRIAVYMKAEYSIKDDVLQEISLTGMYSSEPTLYES